MTYPESSVNPLDLQLEAQVLEWGRVTRAGQLTIKQQLADVAEKERVRAGGTEVLLADEVDKLRDRMAWLHEHPRLRRIIGKSALSIVHKDGRNSFHRTPDTLSTEPLTDGEIANLTEGHLLVSSIVAWRFYDTYGQPELYIDRQVRDETTGVHDRRRRIYELEPYVSSTGPRVHVSWDSKFSAYRDARMREAMKHYTQENPWAEKHSLDGSGRHLRFPYTPTMIGNEHNRQAERLNTELVPHLSPGTSWEYPDDYFSEPLQVVQQLNMLLGTKNK